MITEFNKQIYRDIKIEFKFVNELSIFFEICVRMLKQSIVMIVSLLGRDGIQIYGTRGEVKNLFWPFMDPTNG